MATLSTFFDMVYVQVSGSPGTGNATLGSALIGFQTAAAAGITNGTPVSYRMTDGTNWETAHGTIDVSGGTYTLVRGIDTVRSSNGNSLVNFTASSGITVLICPLSQDLNAFVSCGAAQSLTSSQQQQARSNIATAPTITNFTGFSAVTVSLTSANTHYFAGFGSGSPASVFTPARSGVVLVSLTALVVVVSNAQTGDIIIERLRYGTGTAPAKGAVATVGTESGSFVEFQYEPYVSWTTGTIAAALSLTVGTQYWFDLVLADINTGGASVETVPNVFTILEF